MAPSARSTSARSRSAPRTSACSSYDPAYLNTASCRSSITYIDGDKGILRYRGYDVAELAEKSTYLEVAYLVLYGELPTKDQLEAFTAEITVHTFLHENARRFIDGFRYDAHPMGVLIATVGALSTFYPEAKDIRDKKQRRQQIVRLMAKMPTIAAWSYRHCARLPARLSRQRPVVPGEPARR